MRTVVVLLCALTLAVPALAQDKLDTVLARMGQYIASYQARLASVVAEEDYRQTVETRTPAVRTLRSDYALMPDAGVTRWMGFRDTFEVDGQPVRDREERLQNLLRTGAYAQAARIAEQNSRFNIGTQFVERNINVPTFVLELLQPRYRDRFSFKRVGPANLDGRAGVLIEFRERERPTIVKMPNGRDQASRGTVLVDLANGEVLKTTVQFERVSGLISVTYGMVPGIPVLVPVEMTERYVQDSTIISGRAVYSNYRTFQTSGRVLTSP